MITKISIVDIKIPELAAVEVQKVDHIILSSLRPHKILIELLLKLGCLVS